MTLLLLLGIGGGVSTGPPPIVAGRPLPTLVGIARKQQPLLTGITDRTQPTLTGGGRKA